MHLLSQIIYSRKMLYMLRTVLPSIIGSSKQHIQQLFDIHRCCIRSLGPRWWTERPSKTCRVFYKNK